MSNENLEVDVHGWIKIGVHKERKKSVTDMLTRMILSGLEFSTSTCDFARGFPLHSCSALTEVVSCFCGLATSGKTLYSLRGQSLGADDLRFPRCQKTCTLLGRERLWLHRRSKSGGRDVHEVGAWESQQFRCSRAFSCSCSYHS